MGDPEILDRISAYPELAAIAVLVVGFILARLASLLLGYLLAALDRRISRAATTDAGILTPRLIALTRVFAFWVVMLLAVALSLRTLGAADISLSVNNAITYFVPNALIAFAIIVAGHLLGVLARNLVTQLIDDVAEDSPGPKLIQAAILVVAIVLALQYVGIDITFVRRLLLILVATVGGGLMLAFAMGAPRHVSNLLAHRELGRLSVGERIRIDGVEGTIVEIHTTAVDIATAEGIVAVPASRFAEASVLRMREDKADD